MKDKNLKIILLSLLSIIILTGCYQITPAKPHKYSALHTAVRLGQSDIVKSLVNNKDLNIKDAYGDTPLVDSIRNNSTIISKILICNGADINITDSNNYSLIDLATRNGNIEIINILKNPNNKTLCEDKIIVKKDIVIITKEKNTTIQDTNNSIIKMDVIQKEKSSIKENKDVKIEDEKFNETLTVEELNSYINDDKEIKEVDVDAKFEDKPISEKIKIKNKNDSLANKLSLITLDNSIKFNKDELIFLFSESSSLDNDFRNKLAIFIPQLIDAINSEKDIIKEIRIKNYTSSEFRSKRTTMDKFIANTKVSQRRASDINKYIINISNIFDLDTVWIENNFVSYGMSSQNTIRDIDGNEDKIKSRRTEFEIVLK